VLTDDPSLTVRNAPAPRRPPARIVFDRSLRTPRQSKVVFTAREVPTIIVTAAGHTRTPQADLFRDAGVHLISGRDLPDAFRRLRAAGIQSLLVEGGASLASALLAARLVHRLIIIQAPVALGNGALHAFDGAPSPVLRALETLRVLDRRRLGPDVMTTFAMTGR